jgi:hypothetical protein
MRKLIFFLIAASLFGAQRKFPRGFEPVAQLALSAPPEFAADGLLRLVESKKITDVPTEIELIQQAFDLAASAHFRVGMRAISSVTPDSRAGSLGKAYALNLDSVALQSRAVVDMLPLDKSKARLMFSSISGMDLPSLTCADPLVYEVTPFYHALTSVIQNGFNAKEIAKEDHVAFLLQYVAQVHNPAQIGPMADVLKSDGLTAKQNEAVIAQFGGVLESVSGDTRSFATYSDSIAGAMAPEMMNSFHKFFDKNNNTEQCKADAAKNEAYWQTPDAQRLLAGSRQLRFGSSNRAVLTDADRGKPEWQQSLTDYEKEIADWDVAAEKSEADYYQQKCIVYEALMELIPPGPDRDKALGEFIAFIGNSNLQGQDPVSWFMPAHTMLERVRNTNGGEPAKVLAAFEASGNPVLALYATLEQMFSQSKPSYAASGSF